MAERFTLEEARGDVPKSRRFTIAEAREERGPGPAGALFRGIVQSPASLLEMAENVGVRDPEKRSASILRRKLAESTGLPAPSNAAERILQSVGKDASLIALGAPGAMLAAPAGGALAAGLGELGAGTAASAAMSTADEMGASPGAQMGAGMAAGLVVPSAAVRALRSMGYRGAQPALQQASAKSGLQGRLAIDPETGLPMKDEAIRNLERGIEQFPDPNVRPTSRQLLGKSAGAGFAELEEAKARAPGSRFSQLVAGRRQAVERQLHDEYVQLFGADDAIADLAGQAKGGYAASRARTEAKAREAWQLADLDGNEPASTRPLQKAIDEVVEEAGSVNADALPKRQIRQIQEFGDKIRWSDLQALRSRLGAIESASYQSSSGVGPLRARYARILKRSIDEIIEDLPEDASQRYREAIDAWRESKQLFDPKSSTVKAFELIEDGPKMVQKILGGQESVKEARRTMEILKGEPEAAEAFKRMVLRKVSGGSWDAMTPRALSNSLEKYRSSLVEIFGEEHVSALEEFAKRAEPARTGRAGTSAAPMSVGSGNLMGKDSRGVVMRFISNRIDDALGTDELRNAAIEEALLDPEILVPMLKAKSRGKAFELLKAESKMIARATERAARVDALEAFSGDVDRERGESK